MSITDKAEQLKRKWEQWAAEVEPPQCPWCGSERVWWNGRPRRSVTVLDEEGRAVYVAEVVCRRCRCVLCRKSLRLQPPGIIAHKHYQLCVVAKALSRYVFGGDVALETVAKTVTCSRRTVGRWLRWVGQLADLRVVLPKLVEAADAPIVPKVCLTVRRGSDVLQRAAEMLSLFEHLGNATGREPPGLRGVVCGVLNGRTGVATYARPLIPELARGQGP